MPRIAAEIDAVTSPSWISLIRAPAARISSIRSWWRGRSRTIVVMSLTVARTPRRSPGRSRRPAHEVDPAPRAAARRPSCACTCPAASAASRAAPTAIIDIAPLPPRATTPRPSSGSSARSTSSPPVPIVRADARAGPRPRPPITMRPSIGSARARRASPGRRLLGRLLVGAPEPARAGERRALGHARVALADGRHGRSARLGRAPARAPSGHCGLSTRSAESSTSSITCADRRLGVAILDHRHAGFAARARRCSPGAPDVVEARRGTCPSRAAPRSPRRGRGSACGAPPRPRSRARTGRRARRRSAASMPGTRCTPSSTIDQPSWSARSIAASTPTSTLRVWSRKPSSIARSGSSGADAAASKLE